MTTLPRRVWDRLSYLVSRAIQGFGAHRCTQLAAAISYRFLFSLFPLAIFLVSILGLFLRDAATRQDVVDRVLDVIPLSGEGADQLERVLRGVSTPWSLVGLVSLAVTLWSASGLMASIRIGLNAAWNVTLDRPWVKSKVVDFVLVFGAGLLITASLFLTSLVQIVDRLASDAESSLGVLGPLASAGSTVFGVLVPIVLSFVTFGLLYRFVPATRVRVREVWFAALVAALAFELLKNGFAFYVRHFSNFNVIYGSLGTVLAFLFFVYLSSLVFLFGAEIGAEWDRSAAGRRPYQPPDTRPFLVRVLAALKSLVVLAPVRQPVLRAPVHGSEAPAGRRELLVLGSVEAALAGSFFTRVRFLATEDAEAGDAGPPALEARGVVVGVLPGKDPGAGSLVYLGRAPLGRGSEANAARQDALFVALGAADEPVDDDRERFAEGLRGLDAVILSGSAAGRLTGERGPAEAARHLLGLGAGAVVIREEGLATGLYTCDRVYVLPAFVPEQMADQAGAVDCFAGGFLGYLASSEEEDVGERALSQALLYGEALASFGAEQPGGGRLASLTPKELDERLATLRRLTRLESLPFPAGATAGAEPEPSRVST